MKGLKVFAITWPSTGVGLYAFLQSQVVIPAGQTQQYQVGCAALGFIIAALFAGAVNAK